MVSLLNEMLRNLDARRQLPEVGSEKLVANQAPRKKTRYPTRTLLVFLLAGTGAGAWILLNQYPAPDPVGPSAPTAVSVQPAVLFTENSEISNVRSTDAIKAATGSSADGRTEFLQPDIEPIVPFNLPVAITPDDAPVVTTRTSKVELDRQTENEIRGLLREAELALTRVRLTSPVEDNAYDRYLRVLDLEPEHPEALSGIEYIVVTYAQLVRRYLDANNLERARLLLNRAQRVKGALPSLVDLGRQLQGAEKGTRSPLTDTDRANVNIRQKSSSLKSEEGLHKEVTRLLLNNETLEARYLLEEFLVAHPGSVSTVRRLFRLYLQLGTIDLAEQLLSKSSQLSPVTSIELQAQLRVSQGDLDSAISLLESTTPSLDETSYYALLAGLYQTLGRFREAANHYRRLLDGGRAEGTYWLGLAVSLDSLLDYQGALAAFLRARETRQYEGDVLAYIEQRIRALSSN